MRRALYASGGVHAAIILWIAVGGSLFRPTPDVEFEVTGVTLLSVQEFESLSQGVAPAPVVLESAVAPNQAEEPAAPELDSTPDTPPVQTAPNEAEAPDPDAVPEPVAPVPETEVTDQIAALPSPPPADPSLPPSPRPTPRDAPRVAPQPAPAPAPEVDTAPEVVDQPTSDEASDTPTPDTPPTAPEEATTEIVTEAEEPAGSIAPVASTRPTARPNRPAPVETAAPEPEPQPQSDPTEDAIAAAVAAAVAETTSAPSGPPLSAATRDGFRIAVSNCWNVGSLSSEALRTTVVVGFDMSRDGRPDTGSIRLLEFSGGSQAAAQQAYEAARRAVIRCGATGYDLPEESYDRWAQVELVFNPEGMRLR